MKSNVKTYIFEKWATCKKGGDFFFLKIWWVKQTTRETGPAYNFKHVNKLMLGESFAKLKEWNLCFQARQESMHSTSNIAQDFFVCYRRILVNRLRRVKRLLKPTDFSFGWRKLPYGISGSPSYTQNFGSG
jgi:hypothetical protein